MKRALGTFALLFLGLTIGLPLGIYLVQRKFVDKEKAIGLMNEEGLVDEYAKKEFIYADAQTSREALTYAINIHMEMQGESTLRGWPEKSDLGWCFAELSLIEESAGNTTLAENYMSQAQQILKDLGSKDSSERHIREILHQKLVSAQPQSRALSK